jgi:serine/threonine-protein kinase PknG
MNRCNRNNCTGTIEDGYCNVCGLASPNSVGRSQPVGAPLSAALSAGLSAGATGQNSSSVTGTGSSPLTNRSRGSRRTGSVSSRSTRKQLGAGLVAVPELPSQEPEKALMAEAKVPDNKRFCGNCNHALRREKGFCSKCGQKFSFIPTLQAGDVVAGQYEVKGAIAYGGLGWIYLAFDRVLSRYAVLKGLLNTEDAASAAVAVAERQFLAAVKHPNLVGIYNFVQHKTEGFIVMEYVGGSTLKEIRKQRGPLPVAEAIAYIHRILNAFGYLHQAGLVYCDFKPDNIMLEHNDVKLIDMGGVRRIDDLDGDIYGTIGYTAPEAGEGPTAVSDLFTVGRTLAVLIAQIPGMTQEFRYRLPDAKEVPIFVRYESLYRFLLKATAEHPDDRFQSADEMADQLLGVLREVVATDTGQPRPAASTLFGGDMLAIAAGSDLDSLKVDYRHLPAPTLDSKDPAFNSLLNATAIADAKKRCAAIELIREVKPKSAEASVRLAEALIELQQFQKAESVLSELEAQDPWDWRVPWYQGRSYLAQKKGQQAKQAFDRVYFDLPGELAPKLALGLAAEQAKDYALAIQMYALVLATDPGYVTAAFGLARCRKALNDRAAAVAALEQVPQTSSLYARSRVEAARILVDRDRTAPGIAELQKASATLETLALEGIDRYRLARQVLETALDLVMSKSLISRSDLAILGQPLQEVKLREGLEKVLRSMAHLATGDEKIRLVDEANKVRPKTMF